jgi:probable rRNA maturation factor
VVKKIKKPDEIYLQRIAGAVLNLVGRKNSSLDICFLPDKKMRELEKVYMKKEKKEVDVLSFPEISDFPHPEKEDFLGQIFINKNLATKANLERVKHLAVHGVLHLLGYNHEQESDTIIMEKLEDELLGQLS